jgi:GNAT superfamily N-acetyltransferase
MSAVAAVTSRPYREDDHHACRTCVAELQDAEREIVVRSGFRGQGIGPTLLQAGERHVSEAGATDLGIGVLSDNRPARALYIDEGFTPYIEILASR